MDDARTDPDDADDGRFTDLLVRTVPATDPRLAEIRTGVEQRVARRRRRRVAARAGLAGVAVAALVAGSVATLRTDDGPSVVAVTDDPSTSGVVPAPAPTATTGAIATATSPTTASAVAPPESATDTDSCAGAAPTSGTAAFLALYCGGNGMADDPLTVLAFPDRPASVDLQDRMQASLDLLRSSESLFLSPGVGSAFAPGFLLPGTTVTVDAGAVTIDLLVDLSAVPNATTSNVSGALNRQLQATFFAYPETTSITTTGQCIGDVTCPLVTTREDWELAEAIIAHVASTGPPPGGPGAIDAAYEHELQEQRRRMEQERARQEAAEAAREAASQGTSTTSG